MVERRGNDIQAEDLEQPLRIEDQPEDHHLLRRRPRIVLAEGLLAVIHDYVGGFLDQRKEEVETGGMLVGQYGREEGVPTFSLNGLIDAGPNAQFAPASVLFDHEYQCRMLQALRAEHPEVGNMGCLHLHPGQMDECSIGDYLADLAAVRDSDTKALVFGIITRNPSRPDPMALFHGNCKFVFYVLGRQTGYDYVRVLPRLAAMPVISSIEGVNAGVRFDSHHARGAGLIEDKPRLVAEVRAMEERYGNRASLRYEKNQLFWQYTVMESGRRFPIEVRYPKRFPIEAPRIFSVLPLPSSPHQLLKNELCWINRAAGEWNPARDTAAVCINAAHRWFACLLVYLTLGQWPEQANEDPLHPA